MNERCARLRERSASAEPAISTERAELLTRFYREYEGKHPVPVLADVRVLKGLSGHADSAELLRWLSGLGRPPKTLFLTHGEEESALALADRITRERGFATHVPEPGETWDLEERRPD